MMNDDEVKTIFVCKYQNCDKYFQDPVTLYCGASVCKEHVDDILNRENIQDAYYMCKVCNQEHQVPREGFTINSCIRDVLNLEAHLTKEQKCIKKSLKQFEEIILKLNIIINDPANHLGKLKADEFYVFRSSVDVQK